MLANKPPMAIGVSIRWVLRKISETATSKNKIHPQEGIIEIIGTKLVIKLFFEELLHTLAYLKYYKRNKHTGYVM